MCEEDSQGNLQNERMVDAVQEFGAPWLLNVSLFILIGILSETLTSKLAASGHTSSTTTSSSYHPYSGEEHPIARVRLEGSTRGECNFSNKMKLFSSNPRSFHLQDSRAGIVFLEDGREIRGDIIIGADGIKSQVRVSLFGNNFTAKPSGHSAYRGLVSGTFH